MIDGAHRHQIKVPNHGSLRQRREVDGFFFGAARVPGHADAWKLLVLRPNIDWPSSSAASKSCNELGVAPWALPSGKVAYTAREEDDKKCVYRTPGLIDHHETNWTHKKPNRFWSPVSSFPDHQDTAANSACTSSTS